MKYIVIKKTTYKECVGDFINKEQAKAFAKEELDRQEKKGHDNVSFEIISELGGQDID